MQDCCRTRKINAKIIEMVNILHRKALQIEIHRCISRNPFDNNAKLFLEAEV
jgi:hypothetical protein